MAAAVMSRNGRSVMIDPLSGFENGLVLCRLALGETLDAFMESVHLDQLGTSDPVLGLGRKLRIAAGVEVERDDLRDSVTAHIQTFTRTQALEEVWLLFAQFE